MHSSFVLGPLVALVLGMSKVPAAAGQGSLRCTLLFGVFSCYIFAGHSRGASRCRAELPGVHSASARWLPLLLHLCWPQQGCQPLQGRVSGRRRTRRILCLPARAKEPFRACSGHKSGAKWQCLFVLGLLFGSFACRCSIRSGHENGAKLLHGGASGSGPFLSCLSLRWPFLSVLDTEMAPAAAGGRAPGRRLAPPLLPSPPLRRPRKSRRRPRGGAAGRRPSCSLPRCIIRASGGNLLRAAAGRSLWARACSSASFRVASCRPRRVCAADGGRGAGAGCGWASVAR